MSSRLQKKGTYLIMQSHPVSPVGRYGKEDLKGGVGGDPVGNAEGKKLWRPRQREWYGSLEIRQKPLRGCQRCSSIHRG